MKPHIYEMPIITSPVSDGRILIKTTIIANHEVGKEEFLRAVNFSLRQMNLCMIDELPE